MNKDLLRDNYLIVKNFMPEEQAKLLADGFILSNKTKPFGDCPQVFNSKKASNTPAGLEVLCYESIKVSQIIKHNVIPTYTVTRIYKKDNVLIEHVDREACEISVTVHLDGDSVWPIWIKTPEKKSIRVDLQPGDAMIYLGCIAPHWRNAYNGDRYIQMFLHYIKSGGEYQDNYFDIKNHESLIMEGFQR